MLPCATFSLAWVLVRPGYGELPNENTSHMSTPKLHTSHAVVYFPTHRCHSTDRFHHLLAFAEAPLYNNVAVAIKHKQNKHK